MRMFPDEEEPELTVPDVVDLGELSRSDAIFDDLAAGRQVGDDALFGALANWRETLDHPWVPPALPEVVRDPALRRRRAIVVGSAAVAVSLTLGGIAAAVSSPGSPLYPIRRFVTGTDDTAFRHNQAMHLLDDAARALDRRDTRAASHALGKAGALLRAHPEIDRDHRLTGRLTALSVRLVQLEAEAPRHGSAPVPGIRRTPDGAGGQAPAAAPTGAPEPGMTGATGAPAAPAASDPAHPGQKPKPSHEPPGQASPHPNNGNHYGQQTPHPGPPSKTPKPPKP